MGAGTGFGARQEGGGLSGYVSGTLIPGSFFVEGSRPDQGRQQKLPLGWLPCFFHSGDSPGVPASEIETFPAVGSYRGRREADISGVGTKPLLTETVSRQLSRFCSIATESAGCSVAERTDREPRGVLPIAGESRL